MPQGAHFEKQKSDLVECYGPRYGVFVSEFKGIHMNLFDMHLLDPRLKGHINTMKVAY